MKKQQEEHKERIMRIKDKLKARKIRAILTDESDFDDEESEEEAMQFDKPPQYEVNLAEYNFQKAERKKHKLVISKWVQQFKKEEGRFPTDTDTSPIAMELADYNHANEKYLDIKV